MVAAESSATATARLPRARTGPDDRAAAASRPAIPRLPAGHVLRPRLLALLDEGATRPLTLVSAPAGAGKSVLITAWVDAAPLDADVGWVRDEPGAAPGAVWHDLVEVLGRAGVDVPDLAEGAPVDRLDREVLASLGAACRESPRPLVVVLESEAFAAPDMGSDLDVLLRRSGGQLRLVLVTRADPVAPLHRYRLAGTMLEVRAADLAFTSSEAQQLLVRSGVTISPAAVDQLMLRTQGWAAGLRFAALFLAHRPDAEQAVADFTGDSGTVAEYLLAEVLNVQTPEVRSLLLRTCVVDVLRPGLVDALAGSKGRRTLSTLIRVNAFLEEVPGRPGDHAYHPIFRELLRAELAYESPSSVAPLHLVAADWHFGHGMVALAVQHAVAAGAWDRAADYAVDGLVVAELLVDARTSRVGSILADLPPEVPGAPAALVRAAIALARSNVALCDRELAAARAAARSGPLTEAAELTLHVIGLARAGAVMDVDAGLAESSAALSLVEQVPGAAARRQLVALVHSTRGELLLEAGQVDAAIDALSTGGGMSDGPGTALLAADCFGTLALVAARDGHSRHAVTMAELAVTLVETTGDAAQLPQSAEVALAWTEMERYDLASARRHTQRAAGCGSRTPASEAMLTVVQARLSSARGDLDGAMTRVGKGQGAASPSLPWPRDLLTLERSSFELLAGRPDDAEQTAAGALPAAEGALLVAQCRQVRGEEPGLVAASARGAASPLPVRVRAWLLEVTRLLDGGREREAVRALDRSLRLAEPERLRRPFREAPKPVRRLLRESRDVSERHGWLGSDLARATGGPGPTTSGPGEGTGAPRVVEPLTEKELEVLGHLAALLTTQEIAGEMFLSVNTIRTHVRNILRKLSASRRNEAVRRARELRII